MKPLALRMRFKNKLSILLISTIISFNCAGTKEKIKGNSELFESRHAAEAYIKSYDKTLALWPVPYEEVKVKTSYGIAHVIVSGPKNAPPLILMHGLNASSTMWYPNVKSLAEKNRIYAIDFILEPGKSVPSKKELNEVEEIAKWYGEIFDHFEFKRVNIIGASRGGWLALNIALHNKSRINKIVLLSPAQTFSSLKLKPKVISNITFALYPQRARLKNILKTLSYDVEGLRQPFINQFYIASELAKINKSIFKMTPFSNEELKSLQSPILLLIGEKDIINNEHNLKKAQELIPNIESSIIPHTGHFLSMDQPETINKRILYFLAKD